MENNKFKKTQTFQESWKEEYKWFHFDKKENKTFCQFCWEFPNGRQHALFPENSNKYTVTFKLTA